MYLKFVNLFKKKNINEDIIKIETRFPLENPHGFINAEVNCLFEEIPNLVSYTPCVISREGYSDNIGITEEEFNKNKDGYLKYYKNTNILNHSNKIKYLMPNKKLRANLAYTSFLSQAYILCPFFTKMKMPFVFNLYAGGGFGLNNYASDACLRDIFSNRYFRKVIVCNDVIHDYLIDKGLCRKEKIEFLFGSTLQFRENEINLSKKRFYKKDSIRKCRY